MNSSNNSLLIPQICVNGEKLSASWFYRIVLMVKLLTCMLGIAGNYYLLKIEGIRWVAHPNAKIVYAVHIFWSTYVPIAFCVPNGVDFVRFLVTHTDPCDYTLPLLAGFWIRFFGALGNITQSYTMLAFALERSLATVFPKQYEKIKSSLFGWILGLGAILTAFAQMIILLVLPNNHFNGRGFVTSLVTPENSIYYTQFHLSIMMYLEITTVTIFTLNLIVNQLQKRVLKIGEIAHKYQIKETSKLITALLPCFWIHFSFFFTPTVVLGLRRKMDPPLTDVQNIEWIEVFSMYQLYSIFMPAIVLWLRRRDRRKTVINSHHGMEDHFEQLKVMFK